MIKNYTIDDIEKNTRSMISTDENKMLYGEVYTPIYFVEEILDIIPNDLFRIPYYKWLDPGCGTGNFSIVLYYKLLEGLKYSIPDIEQRKNHIIENMIYMVELRSENVTILRSIFGEKANIYEGDFLTFNNQSNSCQAKYSTWPVNFDIIIGNPPFNSNGLKKTPTNSQLKKKQDGLTIWMTFVIKSISLLYEETGKLCVFIPSIWLKPDKQKMYDYLRQYNIQYLHCISNTKTNQIFKNAQTPSCYFLLTKEKSPNTITIYDEDRNKYINYYLTEKAPIPVFGQEIIKKLQKYCSLPNNINNAIIVVKSNMPQKDVKLSPVKTEDYKYPNISTCQLKYKSNTPELVINYSNVLLPWSGVPKLILAHKMYGFPYFDKVGEYGISNRDNYIIIKEDYRDLIKLQKFLSTKTALYLFEATRYRMKYLEKYAFQLIPDITRLKDFPIEINDETIAEYFGFDQEDRDAIQKLHKKNYEFFV